MKIGISGGKLVGTRKESTKVWQILGVYVCVQILENKAFGDNVLQVLSS